MAEHVQHVLTYSRNSIESIGKFWYFVLHI